MGLDTVHAAADWQNSFPDKDRLEITFHGGEPLAAGAGFYREALPLLHDGLSSRNVRFAVQSNLWPLTPELCAIFREYGVSIGTSLDGPEEINDAQRGPGYFRRTMAGIELARAHGLDVGCICTFTAQSAPRAHEIFGFFLHEGLSFTIHAALPPLRQQTPSTWALSPEDHGELLVAMLDRYLDNLSKIRIGTLDSMARGVSAQYGGICTFGDCLGGYLAVGPDGSIYPCQRFAGMSEYSLGSVHDCPSREQLATTTVWRAFQERQDRVKEECGDCPHFSYCRGGCPYNALASGGGSFRAVLRDPHCPSHRRFFSHVTDRALAEVFSEENMDTVVDNPDPGSGLLRRGKLLSLMRGGPHPYDTAQQARRILGAVALAETRSAREAAKRLAELGVVTNLSRTEAALAAMHRRLTEPATGLNNLYLHITFACNLQCTHCYAESGPERSETMPVEQLPRICRDAAELGFRHVVITGGEPLLHPEREQLLALLADLREEIKPTLTVLRTNLALPMNRALLAKVAASTDEVVVSLDGDRETHDARRGRGSYDRTMANLRDLVGLGGTAEVSLAAVLSARDANGPPGQSVRALAKELRIRRTRFRPLLPLGRAATAELEIVPESLWGHLELEELLAYGFTPTASCGMGQNLYVRPDGAAYPCYAWCGERWFLGNVFATDGLRGIVAAPAFDDLGGHTVNTNLKCRDCQWRNLCGGACRAWSGTQNQDDLDAPPVRCGHLTHRAEGLLKSALEYLGIREEAWRRAELPLADDL